MFEIIVDSAANLPAELVRRYGIRVVSFVNLVDDKPLVCFDPSLTAEEERQKGKAYYDALRSGTVVKTGLVGSGEFEKVFREVLESGRDALYFSLSANISGTYNAARIAAEEAMKTVENGKRIYLIDSLNASLAQGILAVYASEMRDKGMSAEETAKILSAYPARMNGIFTVGDLKYLVKSGRLTNATAVIGNILNIKPILRGNKDGYIVAYRKCRGRRAALRTLVSLVCDNIVNPEEQIIGIAHADAYEESLQIMEEIQKRIKVRGFINTTYDYCTGSHVGPDALALFFMGKDRELEGSEK